MTEILSPPARLPFAMAGPTDKTKAFRAASRHTRHVRFLRRFILAAAAALVLGVAVVAIFDPFGKLPAGFSVQSVGIDGTKVTMSHPKLAGYHNDGRPYEILASSSAVQDIKVPNIVPVARHGRASDDVRQGRDPCDGRDRHLRQHQGSHELTSASQSPANSGLDMVTQDARVEQGAVVTENP